MKHLFIILCILFISLFYSPASYAAKVKNVMEDAASRLILQLPMDQKIEIKFLSPDETGLPKALLLRLSSDLEVALLTASEFEIDLINHLSAEDLWGETTEFGDATFEDLFTNSKVDIILLISTRAVGSRLELSVTSYKLIGESEGQTTTSLGTIVLDLKKNLGINVKTVDGQVSEIITQIQKISTNRKLIESPSNYAEFYHNARIFQQRGENNFARTNYLEAIKINASFYDPLLEYLELLVHKFGKDVAEKAYMKRVKDLLSDEQVAFANVFFSKDVTEFFPRSINAFTFYNKTGKFNLPFEEIYFNNFSPATHALFLRKYANILIEIATDPKFGAYTVMPDDISLPADLSATYLLMRSTNELLDSYNSGTLSQYFIDNIKASLLVRIDQLEFYLNSVRSAQVHPVIFFHVLGSSGYIITSDKAIKPNAKLQEVARAYEKPNYLPSLPCGHGYEEGHTPLDASYYRSINKNLDSPIDSNLIYAKKLDIFSSVAPPFKNFNFIRAPIFADECISQLQLKIAPSNEWVLKPGAYDQESNSVAISAFGLSIFDEVDASKPILLYVNYIPSGEGFSYYTIDLTKDGTQLGFGGYWVRFPEDSAPIQVIYPKIFKTQYIVQSSIMYNSLGQTPYAVSYYDRWGTFRKLPIDNNTFGLNVMEFPNEHFIYNRKVQSSFFTKDQSVQFHKEKQLHP